MPDISIPIGSLSKDVQDKIRAVQAFVSQRLQVKISEEQILEMHLRCLEPVILGKAICFAITQDPIDASDSEEDV